MSLHTNDERAAHAKSPVPAALRVLTPSLASLAHRETPDLAPFWPPQRSSLGIKTDRTGLFCRLF